MNRLLPLAAVLLLSACSAAAAPASPTPSPRVSPLPTPGPTATHALPPLDPTELDGRTFLSVSVTKAGVERPLVPGTRIRLDFRNEGRLGVAAGCNTVGATYRIEAGQLKASDAATTEIGCPQPAQTQDDWVFAFILSGPAASLSGNELMLTRGDLVARFLDIEAADPDRPLVGTTWVVTTILSSDVASSVPAGIPATLEFGHDGRAAVSSGCNTGGGTYRVDGGNMSFGPIALTKKACAGAAAAMERAIVATLGADGLTFEISASTLTLRSAAAGLGLEAK